jgi:hypothetical protein
MVLIMHRRGEVDDIPIASALTTQAKKLIIDSVIKGNRSQEDALNLLQIPMEEYQKLYTERMQEIATKTAIESQLIKPKKTNRFNEEYNNDIQKMISYKGVIRPITMMIKNKYGGMYKMHVLNIYVKPNANRIRNYEEKTYNVDKRAIAKGTEDQGYYPKKALWSQKRVIAGIPKISEEPANEDIIEIPRKRHNNSISLIRKKLKKTIKVKRCKCHKRH